MRIWENFKTKSDFASIKNKRQCWSICHECKNKWEEIETDHVHMFMLKTEARYLCDGCKNKLKDE